MDSRRPALSVCTKIERVGKVRCPRYVGCWIFGKMSKAGQFCSSLPNRYKDFDVACFEALWDGGAGGGGGGGRLNILTKLTNYVLD